MAPGPTDLEAWTALQEYAAELDKVRKPKELKEAMHSVVARSWDMSESRLDFVDFGVIWIDPHYRNICNKFAQIGPGRETFDVATYRTLKTSRLEGYWDVLLENLADWIGAFAKGFRGNVTLADYERLLECMPQSRDLKSYRSNIKSLFWNGPGAVRRSKDFLTQLPQVAYEDAYNMVMTNPPDDGWNLKLIMSQIHDKGIVCKSVMLHVGFWFNPDLEEPANRANVKPPMFHHLKPAFSKYHHTDPFYEGDDSWKPEALTLQRVVLKFTLEWWPRSNAIIGNLGMLREMTTQKYSDYISTFFWNSLLREVRRNTNIPFQHPSLSRFKNVDDLPPDPTSTPGAREDAGMKTVRGQVGNIIREEYSDGKTVDSDDESLEDLDDSTFTSQYTGRDRLRYDSAQPEALTVESEDEHDIILVQTPSPTQGNPSKRLKLQHATGNFTYEGTYDDEDEPQQRIGQKIVKLKLPVDYFAAKQGAHGLVEQPRNSPRKRPVIQHSPAPHPVQEPSPTVSAPSRAPSRATPVLIQPVNGVEPPRRILPRPSLDEQNHSKDATDADATSRAADFVTRPMTSWHHVDREMARNTLDESEGNAGPAISRSQDPEELRSLSAEASHRPRKHNIPPADIISTPNQPISALSQQPLSHPPIFTPSFVAASPALTRTKTEESIVVLQDEYGDTLQIEEMLAAIELLKNEIEAGIFLNLKPGRFRNAWLESKIRGA